MDRTERFYLIDQMLASGKSVPLREMLDRLGVSRATFKRDLEYLRDRLHAPIVWNRDAGGYLFETNKQTGPKYELPGLWFSAQEVFALLTMHHLLTELEPGLLTPHVEPLMRRLEMMLGQGEYSSKQVRERVRVVHLGRRTLSVRCFQTLATGVLKRQRLHIHHYNRERNEETERAVSPQRLVHYRDNWYLDAWCHRKHDLRTFSVDAIRKAELLAEKARDIPDKVMDEHFRESYGIFAGRPKQTAVLRFSPERARWVAAERWHPKQKGQFDNDGSYRLEVPYSDDRELLMDILKHGPEVKVLDPEPLRLRVRNAHLAASKI